MGTVDVGRENSAPIELYYEDHGAGRPVVLVAGWPLDSRSWEPQLAPLLEAGHRVVAYDRRGFGRSSRPAGGYDFDTLAADLDALLTALDLHEATIVGFSLGTGELARYIGAHGTERLASCVFIETLAPSFAMTVRAIWDAADDASPLATAACPPGWLEDFSDDILPIDVPTLILHGSADRILPVAGQGRRLHEALPDARYVEVDGGPHLVCVTHAAEVNRELLAFLHQTAPVGAAA